MSTKPIRRVRSRAVVAPIDASDLLTTEETAELLRRHPEHVRRLARTGRLQGVRTAPRAPWLFRRIHVEAYLSAHTTVPTKTRRERKAA